MKLPRLREWRELRGMTQTELAGKSGRSARSIASYEAGGDARPNTARVLAEALDVAIPDLVESEIPKGQAPPEEATPLDRARELIRRQDVQDRQAANRALESTFAQSYFVHHKSEARRLLEEELDGSALAAALADSIEREQDLERVIARLRNHVRNLEKAGSTSL